MNWTEGALQRHSRHSSSRADTIKMKQSLAKARLKLRQASQNQQTFVASSDSVPRSQMQPRRCQPQTTPIPKQPSRSSPTSAHLSDQSRKTKRKWYPASRSSFQTVDLNEKRRKLLRRGDWVGTSIQKPLSIVFPAHNTQSRQGKWGFRENLDQGNNRWREIIPPASNLRHHGPSPRDGSQLKGIQIKIGSQTTHSCLASATDTSSPIETRPHAGLGISTAVLGASSSDNDPDRSVGHRLLSQAHLIHVAAGLSPESESPSHRRRRFKPVLERYPRLSPAGMVHVESSPRTIHHPVPRRIARFHRSRQSSFADSTPFYPPAANPLLQHLGHHELRRASSRTSHSHESLLERGNEGTHFSLCSPRYNYPPLSASSPSESRKIQPLRQLPLRAGSTDSKSLVFDSPASSYESQNCNSGSLQALCSLSREPTARTSQVRETGTFDPEDDADAYTYSTSDQSTEIVHVAQNVKTPRQPSRPEDCHVEICHPQKPSTRTFNREGQIQSFHASSFSTNDPNEEISALPKEEKAWLDFLELDGDDATSTFYREDNQLPHSMVAESNHSNELEPEHLSRVIGLEADLPTSEGDHETIATRGSVESSTSMDNLPLMSSHAPGTIFGMDRHQEFEEDETVYGPGELPTIFDGTPCWGSQSSQAQTTPVGHVEETPAGGGGMDNASLQTQATEVRNTSPGAAGGFSFAQPKPFVGRFARTPAPGPRSLVQLSILEAPKRGRPKRKARDGRISIRGIGDYYDDPIE